MPPVSSVSTSYLRITKVSPYLEGLSPASDNLSPEKTEDLSAKSDEAGYSGDIGDNFTMLGNHDVTVQRTIKVFNRTLC